MTEKIPEAFSAGCLPITYVEAFEGMPFNAKAFINLANFKKDWIEDLQKIFLSRSQLMAFADEPLIIEDQSISGLKLFITKILMSV
jgi:hypothetical protein